MFTLSEAEYQDLLRRNPHLKPIQSKTTQATKLRQHEKLPETSSKYYNVKVYVFDDGYVSESKKAQGHGNIAAVFDSRREYLRYLQLKLLARAGRIHKLERQKRMEIEPAFVYNGVKERAIFYNADFTYVENGKEIVEDVKGIDAQGKARTTETFRLKWKLLKRRYPDKEFRIF